LTLILFLASECKSTEFLVIGLKLFKALSTSTVTGQEPSTALVEKFTTQLTNLTLAVTLTLTFTPTLILTLS